MFKLLQSLFGTQSDKGGDYPDSLVEAVTERALDGTDARLRMLSGYRKRLREPVLATIDHVVRLVDALPAPVGADAEGYRTDTGLRAMFASLERLHEVLGKDPALAGASVATPLTAALVARISEKRVFGMDLENDQLKRDVQQLVVSFDEHRLLDPDAAELEVRRSLKRRAFDHMLAQVLETLEQRRETRRELGAQQVLLNRKRQALAEAGWSFEAGAKKTDPAELERRLAEIESQLTALGSEDKTLETHLGMLCEALAAPAKLLRLEARTLLLDQRNVLREKPDDTTREVGVHELHDGRGARIALRLLAIDPAQLPRTDFFKAASRYL
jgi:hypothetical protein